MDISDMIER